MAISPFLNSPKPPNSITSSSSTITLPKKPLSCLYSHSQIQIQTQTQKLAINGPSELSGHVSISGSKNAALPILAATLCCSGASKLSNVPSLSDTRTMGSVLSSVGAKVEVFKDQVLVNSDGVRSFEPCSEEVGKIRGGFFVVGPLLGRFGAAVVALPGGCEIGARPVDLYVRGFRALGAVVELRDGKLHAYAANGRGLVGGKFQLDYPSVGATETLLMAACLADGVTVLSNAAKEPEVVSLARFLRSSGACIEGAGTNKIIIKGKPWLHGSECEISPDRIEAGSFMLAAAITRSRISISPVIPSDLLCLIEKLQGAGCKVRELSHNKLEISALSTNLRGFDIKTGPFPAFPTDLQPQTMAMLTTCDGFSNVEECVFENRMSHANELVKLGARIRVCGSTALVFGKERERSLSGASLLGRDLRGGMSLVLAGLAATGTTEISGVEHIDRGYENLIMKLQQLGANVNRSVPIPCPS